MSEKFKAKHQVRCPFYKYSPGGVATVCGRKFTGEAESTVSEEMAQNEAERRCYDKFNNHVNRSHSRLTS